MVEVFGLDIVMAEGDFGIGTPITFDGFTFDPRDELRLSIKDKMDGEALVEKIYTDVRDNSVTLILTESETARLPIGRYVWVIDWYRDGHFMCNLFPVASYKVVKKA